MEPREENPSPPETGSPRGSDPRRVDANGLGGARQEQRAKLAPPGWLTPFIKFWVKINYDWIFNLAGLLAYNLLMTVFPILLVLLAMAGVIIGNLSPSTEQAFEQWIAAGFPGQMGQVVIHGLVATLTQSVSVLLVVGLVGAFIAGSRLFITLENCFGVIFRLRGRGAVAQNLMAVGMLLLYLVLVPVVFLGTLIPPLLTAILPDHGHGAGAQRIITAAHPVLSLVVTAFAIGMTYIFVPNRPVHWRNTWREIWRGALVAAALLLLYEAFFPWYQEHFVHVDNYGSVGAFVIVILLFFYYLGLILLLGAEIDSWNVGQRETAADLPGMLHAIQAHRTLHGAAGPTAGQPQEDLQRSHQPSRFRRHVARLAEQVRARYRRDDTLNAHPQPPPVAPTQLDGQQPS
jgi:membrane protein